MERFLKGGRVEDVFVFEVSVDVLLPSILVSVVLEFCDCASQLPVVFSFDSLSMIGLAVILRAGVELRRKSLAGLLETLRPGVELRRRSLSILFGLEQL